MCSIPFHKRLEKRCLHLLWLLSQSIMIWYLLKNRNVCISSGVGEVYDQGADRFGVWGEPVLGIMTDSSWLCPPVVVGTSWLHGNPFTEAEQHP